MSDGLPKAAKLITRDSSSIPTAVDDGGGVNLGGTEETRAHNENKFN
jgi:hypothetical protein